MNIRDLPERPLDDDFKTDDRDEKEVIAVEMERLFMEASHDWLQDMVNDLSEQDVKRIYWGACTKDDAETGSVLNDIIRGCIRDVATGKYNNGKI